MNREIQGRHALWLTALIAMPCASLEPAPTPAAGAVTYAASRPGSPAQPWSFNVVAGALLASSAGTPRWMFVPSSRQFTRGTSSAATAGDCGPSNSLRLIRYDANGDGRIDTSSGERVLGFLAASARPGPAATIHSTLYALDLTSPDTPRLLWTAGERELLGLGELTAAVTVARVRIGHRAKRNRDPQDFVVILGGGAPPARSASSAADTAPSPGGHIFMLDALTGSVLWSAAADGAASLTLRAMHAAISGTTPALDLDGDDYADRLYAVDAGGQVWRFDVWNGREARDLLSGGVIAMLGDAAQDASAQIFGIGPDIALIEDPLRGPYFNLGIGTQRGPSSNVNSSAWFFSIRDRQPFDRWSQARYNANVPLSAADLPALAPRGNAQVLPTDAPGWKLNLGAGTQVMGPSLTAAGVLLFTAFTADASNGSECARGANRLYALAVNDGTAAIDLDADGRLEDTDLSGAVPDDHAVLPIQTPMGPYPDAEMEADLAHSPAAICSVGGKTLPVCIAPPSVQRTFWERKDAI